MSIRMRRICCIGLTLITLGMLAAAWPLLPEQIPSHWGLDGQVSYGSKGSIWMFGAMLVIFNIMFEIYPHIDPKKRNYDRFLREYNIFCVCLNGFILIMLAALLWQCFRPGSFSMARFSCFILGLLLVVMGNMMPKFKPNFSSGIKTPWALTDEENWRKTHRLGGKLFFISGLAWMGSAAAGIPERAMAAVGVVSVLAASGIPYGMSYIWWRKTQQ